MAPVSSNAFFYQNFPFRRGQQPKLRKLIVVVVPGLF
jgi:hypothetical protein